MAAAAGKRRAGSGRATKAQLHRHLRSRLSNLDPSASACIRGLSFDDQRVLGLCITMQQFVGDHGPEVEAFKREANVVLCKSGVGSRCHAAIRTHKKTLQALVRAKVFPVWGADVADALFEPIPAAASAEAQHQAIRAKCSRLDALLIPADGEGLLGRLIDRHMPYILQ